MSRWEASLSVTAYTSDQIPDQDLPEVVLVGRSNVGKSTLINTLLDHRIAHVSSKPGKTRSINFYRVRSDPPFCLVDLPGYGFAARGAAEIRDWRKLANGYFKQRSSNVLVIHLVDFRHGFLEKDKELQRWLGEIRIPVLVVFTKGDKISRGRTKGVLQQYTRTSFLSVAPPAGDIGNVKAGCGGIEKNFGRISPCKVYCLTEEISKSNFPLQTKEGLNFEQTRIIQGI